jgi:hypothetical protein
MLYRPHRFLLVLSWLLLSALLGCGYIGYDGRDPRDAAASEDAGMDAAEPAEDAEVELDAEEPAPDADEPTADAEVDQDADLLDASEPDAGADADAAAPADASADAQPADAGSDASDAARPATPVSDYCVQVPALPSPPVIDGVVDGALTLVTIVPLGWTNTGTPLPRHTTAEYAFAFRPDGLYAFVRVHDPNRQPALAGDSIWRGDSVEIYADDDGSYGSPHVYDNPGSIQIIVAAPESDATPATRATRFREASEVGSWTSTRFGAYPTADGYTVEAFLEASALDRSSWALSSGGHVGIDVGVNVSPSGEGSDGGAMVDGRRLGQYFLRVGSGDSCNGMPFCTPVAFCNPLLID